MSAHPKHGVKEESEKIRTSCAWGGSKTKHYKLLVRSPGQKVWRMRATGPELRAEERQAKAEGLETLLQRL